MVAIKLELVLFLNIFYVSVSDCVRRIKGGLPVSTEKRYVVYLVKAPMSDKKYDTWLCGGALVSALFIVTSAACVDDVEYLYAIAGYKKYVTDDNINTDACTKAKKKKVIYTCIPMKYELSYNKLEKWSFIDIALVKVESAYDFKDESYKTVCSYIPTTISINYEPRFQEPGTDSMVFGWGHTDVWRQPHDEKNYNQQMMRYASTKIMEKEECKKHYESFPNMSEIIDQFMICTLEKGEMDENGNLNIRFPSPKANGCSDDAARVLTLDHLLCDEEDVLSVDKTRREVLRSNNTSNETLLLNTTKFNETKKSRKSGICQNDHGGPLVTWVGANEVLIGVASVFKVSDDSYCMGPYLYTSTQCNGAFLDCILTNSGLPDKKGRRAICDSPPIQRGYDTVEKYISWRHHPAGAAENEALANVKYIGHNDNESASNAKAYKEFEKLNKFSQDQIFAIRPQKPIVA